MKAGDLIRITARHNPRYHTPAPGDRGFIDEVFDFEGDEWANVVLLHEDGRVVAVGGHPIRLLAYEGDPLWAEAKRLHDADTAAHTAATKARTEHWHKHVAKVAAEFDLSPETAEALYNRMDAWEGNQHG